MNFFSVSGYVLALYSVTLLCAFGRPFVGVCESNKNDVISISYGVIAFLGPIKLIVSQAIRIFPRAHARGKGGGGREGKIRLVRCARFSFRLPECWQSQSNSSIQSN